MHPCRRQPTGFRWYLIFGVYARRASGEFNFLFVSVTYKYEATAHENLETGFSPEPLVVQPVFN